MSFLSFAPAVSPLPLPPPRSARSTLPKDDDAVPRYTPPTTAVGRWRRSLKSLRFAQVLGISSPPIYAAVLRNYLLLALLPSLAFSLSLSRIINEREEERKGIAIHRGVIFVYCTIRFFDERDLQIKRQRAFYVHGFLSFRLSIFLRVISN